MKKEIVIVGGPNGSGKTTFAKTFLLTHKKYKFINPDEIAMKINPENISIVGISAGKQYVKQINSSLQSGGNIVIESTLSGLYTKKWIEEFRKKRYAVSIVYTFLDSPRVCIERIKERVKQGGHYVPDSDVTRRFYRSKQNFWNIYKEMTDSWYLYFNGHSENIEVAAGEKLGFEIKNEKLFKLFMEDIKIK